jgi:catechol-2,3-dioxygenase
MNRRDFLTFGSSMTILALDSSWIEKTSNFMNSTSPGSKSTIEYLELLTNLDPGELTKFYHQSLGLAVRSESNNHIEFSAGTTSIRFVITEQPSNPPFYHFAFNIPENKILSARNWQLKRSALIPSPLHMTDPGFPADIRHFKNWNAHSVFFWDPAGNLLEFIARHDLNNAMAGEFSSKEILLVSEIALIVNDVDLTANQLKSKFALSEYRQGSENFRAIGDENGLLLIMKKGRIWMDNTDAAKSPEVFKTQVSIKGNKNFQWDIPDYPYRILPAK